MQAVKYTWLSKKYKDKFPKFSSAKPRKETNKAVLLKVGKAEQWVPKAAISPANAIMSEEDAAKEAQRHSEKLIGSIHVPLKHASADMYDGLLRLPLEQYQKDIIYTLEGKKRAYLGCGMGVGKTPIALARTKLFDDGKPTLLICKKGLMYQWHNEILKFCPELEDRIHIINYDRIWRDSSKEFMSQFHDGNFNMILEEVACLANEGAKRTAKCMELAEQCDNLQMLSGSFFGGKFEKFYPCAVMQGFAGTRADYEELFTVKVPTSGVIRTRAGLKRVERMSIVGYKYIDFLIKRVAELGAVFVRTDDVLRLDEPHREDILVHATPKYKKAESKLFKPDLTDDESLKALVDLKMAGSLGNMESKQDAVRSLLEDNDERWIVFYAYDVELEWLRKLCKKLGRPMFEANGHNKNYHEYDKHPNSVIAINVASNVEGLNMQGCNHSIFTSIFDADKVSQAEARTRRHGQTKPCMYYTLVVDSKFDAKRKQKLELDRQNIDNIH